MIVKRTQMATLKELVAYYRECLALEWQGEVIFGDDVLFTQPKFPPKFFPVTEIGNSWDELLSTKSAKDAVDLAKRGERRAVLFAPSLFAFRDGNERKWEPVTGVFCRWSGSALSVDPTDIFVGSCIRSERAMEEINEVKALLERAARQSPKVFAEVSLSLLPEQRALTIEWSELKRLTLPQAVKIAGFLVIGESPYDRALLEELEQLSAKSSAQTALNFLFAPPSVGLPDLTDVLMALANPVCPTLSQAIALAHAIKFPLTVITGPPGTGKTRIIVGLIIHHLLIGRSILLASKINRAVDAAVELAERLLGEGCILRTGRRQEVEKLQERLSELLGLKEWGQKGELFSGMRQLPRYSQSKFVATQIVQTVAAKAQQLARQIQERSERLNRISRKLARFSLRPVCAHHYGRRDLAKLFCRDCWRRWRWSLGWQLLLGERRWIMFRTEWQALMTQLETFHDEILPQMRNELVCALWLRLNDLLHRGRKALENLQTSLSDRRERLKAFRQIADLGFPIAVTNLSIGNNLPLDTCFDTLIVDEASSCDPASLLPLLYRARRAVIVGDPKQLDHVTQERWKEVKSVPLLRSINGEMFEANFGVSTYSLFEHLIGGENRAFWLTDHFRCPPPIIAFANEQFYGGRLRIRTQTHETNPISVQKIEGEHRRNAANSLTNDAQIFTALRLLQEWALQFPQHTLGLVAPYRAFVDDVLDIIYSDPSLEILRERCEKQELIIGTAHRFQGSEVDYLIFATVAGDNGGNRESRWVEHRNLFNVAVTRARRKLVILLSPKFEKHLVLTHRLLKAKPVSFSPISADERKFVKEVAKELVKLGIAFRQGAIYHGDQVDLVAESDEPEWGALLVSWEDAAKWKPIDVLRLLDRYQALQKRGLRIWLIFPPEFENWVAELLTMGYTVRASVFSEAEIWRR